MRISVVEPTRPNEDTDAKEKFPGQTKRPKRSAVAVIMPSLVINFFRRRAAGFARGKKLLIASRSGTSNSKVFGARVITCEERSQSHSGPADIH
ncbi:hypothetical protein NPX13_g2446 [Xylaria arbuscula]|uniref:Uncharacterized protein n=1 Tax=Xylaria arbuscula TaxID=114810 RepID=A0A9W8NKF7_9PEZI|nr:hypothetical protein NPX13_g2446 [Xylaria arbuscula]